MNPYYHHTVLQPRYNLYGPMYRHAVRAHYTMGVFHPRPVEYVDDVAIFNAHNTMWVNHQFVQYRRPEHTLEAFTEETLIMEEVEADHLTLQRLTTDSSGSGLSDEEISEHLRVYTAQGKMIDQCSICLGEYEKGEKIGMVECGHWYHAECIKRWLLSKNVCPMCRSIALTV